MGLALPNKQLGSKIVKQAPGMKPTQALGDILRRHMTGPRPNPRLVMDRLKPINNTGHTDNIKRNYFYDPKQPWLK